MDPHVLVIIVTLATGGEHTQHYRVGSFDTCQQLAIAARRRTYRQGHKAKVECLPEFESDRVFQPVSVVI